MLCKLEKLFSKKIVKLVSLMSKNIGQQRLGHIPFGFDSLVQPPVQGYIFTDRCMLGELAGAINFYIIEGV